MPCVLATRRESRLAGILQSLSWLPRESAAACLSDVFLLFLPCSVGEPDCLQGNPLVFRNSQQRRLIPQPAPVIVAQPRAFNIWTPCGTACP